MCIHSMDFLSIRCQPLCPVLEIRVWTRFYLRLGRALGIVGETGMNRELLQQQATTEVRGREWQSGLG